MAGDQHGGEHRDRHGELRPLPGHPLPGLQQHHLGHGRRLVWRCVARQDARDRARDSGDRSGAHLHCPQRALRVRRAVLLATSRGSHSTQRTPTATRLRPIRPRTTSGRRRGRSSSSRATTRTRTAPLHVACAAKRIGRCCWARSAASSATTRSGSLRLDGRRPGSEGARGMTYFGRLFRSRSWEKLVPDAAVLTAGRAMGATIAASARASDGSSVIVYAPSQRGLTVNMTKVAGTTARAWWFNPVTGTATSDWRLRYKRDTQCSRRPPPRTGYS